MRIDELHERLYELLKIVDEICRRNAITYWMHGGSAIGAVREHDFILWDDDMDILIKAEDYTRFREVMRRELPAYLKFTEPGDFDPFFYDYIIRIVDSRWKLRHETDEDVAYMNYQNSVCIDVFLLSWCPDTGIKQKLWLLKYDIIYGMAINYRFLIDWSKYRLVQKIMVAVLKTMGGIYSGKTPHKIVKKWEQFIHSCESMETGTRMISNTVPHCYWHPMPDEWFQKTVYSPFRDIKVPLPKEFDKQLTFIYGNYMVPERDTSKYKTHLSE